MNIKPWWIITIGLCFFIYIVAPIFSSGTLLNQDEPAQYLRMYCLSNSNIPAPNNWCPLINAGTPSGQYYYPIGDEFVVLLGKLIGLPLAFKIFLVLALLILAIAIWLWLKDRHPFGAAIGFVTYLFFTAGWHSSGYQETILVGFASYMWSIGFLLIALYYYNRYLSESNKYNLIKSVLLTTLILHPLTILVAVICYIGLTIVNYKNLKMWNILKFVLCAGGINAFYIIPLIYKLQWLPSSTGGFINWSMFIGYVWNPISQAFFGIPVFFLLSCFAVYVIVINKDNKEYPLLGLFITMILYTLSNFIVNSSLNKFMVGIRLGALLGPLIIIMVCLAIDYLYNYKNQIVKWVTLIVSIIILIFLFTNILPVSRAVVTSQTYQIEDMYQYLNYMSPENGRILMETMPGSHMPSLLPILTGREIIGFGTTIFPKSFNLIDVTGPTLFAKPLEQWTHEQLNEVFVRYNIKYLFLYSPNYISYFDKYLNSTNISSFKLYDTGINVSYIKGNVEEVKYSGTTASALVLDEGEVMLSVNYYPNWKASYYGYDIPTYSCNEMVCVNFREQDISYDSGIHIRTVPVIFEYKLIFVDYLGYFISVLTLLIMIVLKK